MKIFSFIPTCLFFVACANVTKENIVVIKAQMEIKSDSVEAFKTMAQNIIYHTRKEAGCLEYTLYQDAYNPTKFFFYEEYKDEDAVTFHSKQSYLEYFRERRKYMLLQGTKPSASVYRASKLK